MARRARRQNIVVGPWGGSGGQSWDDGSYDGIREIQLSHGDAIGSFGVIYDLNGEPFAGPQHPSNQHHFTIVKIVLQPEEFIVRVSGHIGPVPRFATQTDVIRSLTFTTNLQRTFGPYGAEEGKAFDFPIENGLIVGIEGRSGEILDAIAFHLSF